MEIVSGAVGVGRGKGVHLLMCLDNYSLTYSASTAERNQRFPGVLLKLLNGCIVRLLLSNPIP